MFLGSNVRPVRTADNLAANLRADCLDNVRFLTSHNLIGLQDLFQGWLLVKFYVDCINSRNESSLTSV
jgi:hypothetical protein